MFEVPVGPTARNEQKLGELSSRELKLSIHGETSDTASRKSRAPPSNEMPIWSVVVELDGVVRTRRSVLRDGLAPHLGLGVHRCANDPAHPTERPSIDGGPGGCLTPHRSSIDPDPWCGRPRRQPAYSALGGQRRRHSQPQRRDGRSRRAKRSRTRCGTRGHRGVPPGQRSQRRRLESGDRPCRDDRDRCCQHDA